MSKDPDSADFVAPSMGQDAHAPSGLPTAVHVTSPRPQRAHRTFLIIVGVITVIYVATFVKGLWWQWQGIILAQPATVPVVTDAPRGAEPRGAVAPGGAPGGVVASNPLRKPLPRTDVPAPRNTTDERGVTYDAEGVAVMGIDADPSGVYNVPTGRQVRIGGPAGTLYDVGEGGKLTPGTKR